MVAGTIDDGFGGLSLCWLRLVKLEFFLEARQSMSLWKARERMEEKWAANGEQRGNNRSSEWPFPSQK